MELNLAGKRALVTGSSSGIGIGIAEALAAEGVTVVVHGRDAKRTEGVAEAIRKSGGKAIAVIGDIANDAGGEEVAKAIRSQLGGVDILVNCAGGLGDAGLNWENSTPEKWAEQYQLNVVSAVRMIQHFLPEMKKNRWGRIIQISSIASTRPLPNQVPAYAASKNAMVTLSVSLAISLADTGITVNTVSPGYVKTPLLVDYVLQAPGNEGKTWEEVEPALAKENKVVVGRMGRPEDVGSMVAYLASPVAVWITGSNFRVDGGMTGFID